MSYALKYEYRYLLKSDIVPNELRFVTGSKFSEGREGGEKKKKQHHAAASENIRLMEIEKHFLNESSL